MASSSSSSSSAKKINTKKEADTQADAPIIITKKNSPATKKRAAPSDDSSSSSSTTTTTTTTPTTTTKTAQKKPIQEKITIPQPGDDLNIPSVQLTQINGKQYFVATENGQPLLAGVQFPLFSLKGENIGKIRAQAGIFYNVASLEHWLSTTLTNATDRRENESKSTLETLDDEGLTAANERYFQFICDWFQSQVGPNVKINKAIPQAGKIGDRGAIVNLSLNDHPDQASEDAIMQVMREKGLAVTVDEFLANKKKPSSSSPVLKVKSAQDLAQELEAAAEKVVTQVAKKSKCLPTKCNK